MSSSGFFTMIYAHPGFGPPARRSENAELYLAKRLKTHTTDSQRHILEDAMFLRDAYFVNLSCSLSTNLNIMNIKCGIDEIGSE